MSLRKPLRYQIDVSECVTLLTAKQYISSIVTEIQHRVKE